MNSKEFKLLISKSPNSKWFNEIQIPFSLPHHNYSQTFNGLSAFYDFINQQVNGWGKLNKDKLNGEITQSIEFWDSKKQELENFVANFSETDINRLENQWRNQENSFKAPQFPVFLYSSVETKILISILENTPNYYLGAYQYIIGNVSSIQSDKNLFIGATLANDLLLNEAKLRIKQTEVEQKSLSELKSDFQNYLSDSSSLVTEHLTNALNEYKKYVESLEELKGEKDLSFQEWFANTQQNFSEFDNKSNEKISDLESLYRDKLMLEEPAKYWEKRAKSLKKAGIGWVSGLIIVTIVGVITLICLINSISISPKVNILANGKSIRILIGYLTLISFIAFLIRTFTKLTFSTFHLVRDAEERHQLTYVYLALKENSAVNDTDRQIILQSIFSRADSGLLKEDSAPTMPSTIIEKFNKSGN